MRCRCALLVVLVGVLVAPSSAAPAPPAPAKSPVPAAPSIRVRLVPPTARQGDTVLVFVAGTRGAREVEGSLGGHHLAFFPYGEGAVPASTRTGTADAAHQHSPLASERSPW